MIAINSRNPEIHFKPVSGGWVFRAPNPWMLGASPHYLVTDDRKDRIIDAVTLPYAPQMAAVAYYAFLAWRVTIVVVLAYGFGQAIQPVTVIVIGLLIGVLPVLVWTVSLAAIQRHRLKPVLADASPTNERITYAEMRRAYENSISPEQARSRWFWSAGLCVVTILLAIWNTLMAIWSTPRHGGILAPIGWTFVSLIYAWEAVR